ncbi:hypothetical protein [Gemmobacter caeni]|jgi:hypothetical protein|uniref:Uncharacterized protein n=1 Tax=Gemmobacter nanjingensis TaxID=488454 RepID=A0ABQ3FJH5_9RHOB|nr:hypothetical protein [Gemmobacter caeni]GHC26954.1 hypothetical protein GCM10007291_28700 [Gemmobacter nanjingensis]
MFSAPTIGRVSARVTAKFIAPLARFWQVTPVTDVKSRTIRTSSRPRCPAEKQGDGTR